MPLVSDLSMLTVQFVIQSARITHHQPIFRLSPHGRIRGPTIPARFRSQLAASRFAILGKGQGTHGVVCTKIQPAGVAVVMAVTGFAPKGGGCGGAVVTNVLAVAQ